jgi:hypothetical protein
MMKTINLAVLGFILLTRPLVTTATQFGDFTYTSSGSSITITRYTGFATSVTIPNTIAGLPVTRIGDSAFVDHFNLREVTISSNVTTIGSMAFGSCTALASVTIPGSVTRIEGLAFTSCGLGSVTIPASVTYIGGGAFNACKLLSNVIIPSSVASIADGTFNRCERLLFARRFDYDPKTLRRRRTAKFLKRQVMRLRKSEQSRIALPRQPSTH